MFHRVSYASLNSRQKENYNFQKVAGVLADYGYNCLRLSDDWQGADFIGCHISGDIFLKVQLKGRLTLDRKYQGKEVHVAFFAKDACFIYPHDAFLHAALDQGKINDSVSWKDHGSYTWPSIPGWAKPFLENYKV